MVDDGARCRRYCVWDLSNNEPTHTATRSDDYETFHMSPLMSRRTIRAVASLPALGPGHPQPNGAPREKVFTGFPLQLIFAEVIR